MPERRTLRSNKDTVSSTDSEKARSDSQNTSSKKDQPVPARATLTKAKGVSGKKGTNSSSQEMSGDKPQTNGVESNENGVNGVEDVEMSDEKTPVPKSGSGKDGEDEMTVVVPPSKGSKLIPERAQDADGDVTMDPTPETVPKTEEVDPAIKTIAGVLTALLTARLC